MDEPKRAKSASMHYAAHRRAELRNEKSAGEITAQAKEEWKAMSYEQKYPFEERAREDRLRYDLEKASFKPAPVVVDRSFLTRAGRLKKDPDRPTPPRSSYYYYMLEMRPVLKESQPPLSVPALTKALAEGWRKLSDEDKALYKEKSAADQERFKQQVAAYAPSAEFAKTKEQYEEVKKHRRQSRTAAKSDAGGGMGGFAAGVGCCGGGGGGSSSSSSMGHGGVISSGLPPLAGEKRDAPDVAGFFVSDDAADAMAESALEPEAKRRRGRPLGSKNKPKPPPGAEPAAKRGRGRPKGSKNKPKLPRVNGPPIPNEQLPLGGSYSGALAASLPAQAAPSSSAAAEEARRHHQDMVTALVLDAVVEEDARANGGTSRLAHGLVGTGMM